METIIHALDKSQLDAVTDAIHDCEFELSDVKFDDAAGVLEFGFKNTDSDEARYIKGSFLKQYEEPMYSYRLFVRSVRTVSMKDAAQIGTYPLEYIEFDEERSSLLLQTNILDDFTLTVDKIDILVVRESAEPVGMREYRSIF